MPCGSSKLLAQSGRARCTVGTDTDMPANAADRWYRLLAPVSVSVTTSAVAGPCTRENVRKSGDVERPSQTPINWSG
ncbi:MAG: hypothetical protein WDW38_003712 [Sanguina aurantia]